MYRVLLKRMIDTGVETLGAWSYAQYTGGIVTLISLELPWKDNTKSISCIPAGIYKVTTTYSNKYKRRMWQVQDVEGRSGIRIHSANFFDDIEGCISLGYTLDDLDKDGELDIVRSRDAIKQVEKDLGEEFELEIIY